MCIVCIANNINRNVYMYLNTRIFPTTGYARLLLFMFIRRELGGTDTGCLFQFTYCAAACSSVFVGSLPSLIPFAIRWAPQGFWGSLENGYLFSGSWGALVIILGELGSKLIILGI